MSVSRWRVLVLSALSAPLVLFGLLSLAYWAGGRADSSEVVRNVRLAGLDVGGMKRTEAQKAVERLAEALPTTPITIVTPEFKLTTTAKELGVNVDTSATLNAAFKVGHSDRGPLAPVRWFKSLFAERPMPIELEIDRQKADAQIALLEGPRRSLPVEPALSTTVEAVGLTPGVTGKALDVSAVLSQVPLNVSKPGTPITITTEQRLLKPTMDDETIAALAEQARNNTEKPITITAGSNTVELDARTLRPALRVAINKGKASLELDATSVSAALDTVIPPSFNPTGVKFTILNGVPTPIAGVAAEVCCAEDSPDRLAAAVLDGKQTVELKTSTMSPEDGVAWANTLGVKEVIGEFTTNHGCCESRVTNIHRISDLTQGVLIAPGETFSANDFVGKRTPERGFVSAGVIEDGEFKEDFGGGVSQWATTTFNAAFFGGLDIPVHKAHSIYISRYPYGREATLAFPSVDLKLRNNTPYGVVIWPTYTDRSITVQLWSTKFATGEQTAMKTSKPKCGSVKVTRTRTFLADGHTENDTFAATYDCDPPKH